MKADDVLAYAQMELGKPYVWGDEGPGAFDCSGLIQWVFGKVGIKAPRTAADQQAWARRVASPAPGDLVFWGEPAYHVGLYVGGGKVINAPEPGATVRVQDVWGQPTYGRVDGIGAAFAPVFGVATGAASTVAGWLGGARYIALEGAFIVLGLALLGYGAYRVVAPQITRIGRALT